LLILKNAPEATSKQQKPVGRRKILGKFQPEKTLHKQIEGIRQRRRRTWRAEESRKKVFKKQFWLIGVNL